MIDNGPVHMRTVNGIVYEQIVSGYYLDESLIDAVAWFQARLAEVPEPFRASAWVRIDGDDGFISIGYQRPETEQEAANRLARKQAIKARREARGR